MGVEDVKNLSRQGRRSIMPYPHPSFDLSSAFIPPSMKELYRWCLYLYMTHSEVKPILKKKVAYVQTPLVYDGADDAKHLWKEVLEETINIKRVEIESLLDMSVYGVAYVSIYYPFERFLLCPSCNEKFPLRNLNWRYENYEWLAKCPKCNHNGAMESKTQSIRNRSRVSVIRWRPQDMEVRHNPWTGHSEYIYRMPKYLRKRIEDPVTNKIYVESTPDELLVAVKERKNFKLRQDQIFVFKESSPSSDDEAFPIPPLLHVFKDSWLYQTLRRAQEAISVEHILPLTILVPNAVTGAAPHMNYDLQAWADHMQEMVRRWRRDPNMIYTAPFPATVENIRGDAQALNVFRDMEQVRQQIAGGLDVPVEFVVGNLQWSGASVSLRVLENLFLNMIEDLERFEQTFLIPQLRKFLRLPNIDIRHQKFKMADDAQQKQIALGLRQTNTISDETTVEELGFDHPKEEKRKKVEFQGRLQQMREQQIEGAKVQAEAMLIQAKAQMQIQRMQAAEQQAMMAQQQQQAMQAQAAQQGQLQQQQAGAAQQAMDMMKQEESQLTNNGKNRSPGVTPYLLNMMAEHFMKSTPDDQKVTELSMIQETNPGLARAIQNRMKLIAQSQKAVQPLPEQKPPRRQMATI